MMNYNQNLFFCGNRTRQEIKLTFANGEYRHERSVIFYSNMMGLEAIRYAVENVYESLPDAYEDGTPGIVLTTENGDELHCSDDDDQGELWLFNMVINAEIVSVTPAGKVFDPIPEDATK